MAVLDATIKAIAVAIMQSGFIIASRAPETDYPLDRSVSRSQESNFTETDMEPLSK